MIGKIFANMAGILRNVRHVIKRTSKDPVGCCCAGEGG